MRITSTWATAALLLLGLSGCSDAPQTAVHIKDIHGLALDPDHSSRLYVATHHGLFVGDNDTKWAAVTTEPFDMMGFSMHSKDGRIMYASGHPSGPGRGWAVGVVRSEDAGRTWSTLGLKDEVDFHAMAMEPGPTLANDTIYGFHAGKIHVSADGGFTWSARAVAFPVAALAVEPSSGDLWAATPEGIKKTGRGAQGAWQDVSPRAASSIAASPAGATMFAYFDQTGLSKSVDKGKTWKGLNWTVPAQDYPWGIARGPESSKILYVGTARGTIHKSTDDGASWTQIR